MYSFKSVTSKTSLNFSNCSRLLVKHRRYSTFFFNRLSSPPPLAPEEGLALIGAEKHLELFQQQSKKVKLMSSVKLNKFLKGKLEGVNPIRDLLNNDPFFEIDENLVTLNANFLKSHPDFEVLSVDDMFATLEEFVGHEIKRE